MSQKLKLEVPWEKVKEMLQEINTDLDDEDLEFSEEREDEMLQRVAKKMNRSIEHTRMWIESVSGNHGKAG